MWRRSNFQPNQDSDQSISDEEEIEFHCSERCISLDGPSRRVEPNLAMQFDLLTGGIKVKERGKQMTVKKTLGSFSEDEVETPFLNKGGFDCERSKDENDYVGSASLTSWSQIHEKQNREPLNFEGMPFAEEEDLDSQEATQLVESLPTVEYHSLEKAPANPVENIIRELEDSVSDKAFGRHESSNSSMADLLDGLQEKKIGSHAILRRVRKKGGKRKVGVKHPSLAEKRTSDDEGLCEIIDNGSSSDDVCKDKSIVLATTEPKRKTMADQFQEALGATSVNEHPFLLMPKQSSNGLLEKLQRVIQREKEHGMDFMQNLRSETLADEAGYIDVKLLSRSFEAKLTVCLCSINCYKKGSVIIEKFKETPIHTTSTIIFTSKTCGDVELDAGTRVRIYPPWKEVQVLGGDIVILASYFRQTLT